MVLFFLVLPSSTFTTGHNSVDHEAETTMQEIIDTDFKECTVLVVMHRLEHSRRYDKAALSKMESFWDAMTEMLLSGILISQSFIHRIELGNREVIFTNASLLVNAHQVKIIADNLTREESIEDHDHHFLDFRIFISIERNIFYICMFQTHQTAILFLNS